VTDAAVRPRIAVFDRGEGHGDALSILARQAGDIVRVDRLSDLLAREVDHAVAWVTPDEMAALARDLSGRPNAPPVTLMAGAAVTAHPQTRFIEALVLAKREWEATFDAILDPLAIVDASGIVRRSNLAFARALGKPIREVVARPFAELLGAPIGGKADPVARSLADSAPRTEEARYGTLRGVHQVTISPWRDEGGKLSGLVVLLKDLTEQKEHEQRLQQAARLADIGQLAAGVAHEINTPLASIALRAESLQKSALHPELAAVEAFKNFPRYLKTIEDETFRCKKIIRALLEFSSSRRPEVRPTDLNALAERAADLVGHQMRLKQVNLALRLDSGLGPVPVDDGQVRQVLLAFLMNALDATKPGGNIEVATGRRAGALVTLAVGDDGTGISAEVREKLFAPFFTTKPFGQGTGLGLAICHGIVASHGGTIEVESEVGRGTRFTVVLPAGAGASPG